MDQIKVKDEMRKPLDGIRVLDFSRALAGPYCSMYMADMGAEVIKVEEPKRGDDARAFGPPFIQGESAYFMSVNRGKLSIALNLKLAVGLEIARRLASKCDVILENFRPGVMDRMGLGYEQLRKQNPSLIYASISGFGHSGLQEYSKKPGYDVVIQGMGGITSITGYSDSPPTKVGVAQADLIAGLNAFQGILLALLVRDRSGKGQKIDISMLDCQISLLSFQAGRYFATGRSPGRIGNAHPTICPYETIEACDGYLNIGVGNDRLFEVFCEIIGKPELVKDERFCSNSKRVENRSQLLEIIEPIFKGKTVKEWLNLLEGGGIPCGPVNSVGDALNNPQVIARQMVIEMNHPKAGKIKVTGCPIKLSETPPKIDIPPPVLGQHTEKILREYLNMDEEEINRLKRENVI
jgi:crotonobetainyl-CoA:carnitine CoA-transferase CaiB-like acyl-CoA transferase